MRLLVAMKQVIDPMTDPPIAGGPSAFGEGAGAERIINPFDECALETALRLMDCRRSTKSEDQLSVLTVGPESAESMLRQALAIGATNAIRIDTVDADLDAYLVASVLVQAARDLNCDLVILGKVSTDEASGEVAQRLGAMLKWPQLTAAATIDIVESVQLLADVTVAGCTMSLQTRLPAVVSVDRRILAAHAVRNDGQAPPSAEASGVRYASLPAIVAARRKPIQVCPLAEYIASPQALIRTVLRCPISRPSACLMHTSVEQLARSIRQALPIANE